MNHYYSKNPDSKSEPKLITYHYKEQIFTFKTDHGVFSRDYVDFGTNLLINSIVINDDPNPILDLCCGYGVVGIVIKSLTNKEVYATDINQRATDLAVYNAKINKVEVNVYNGDLFSSLPKEIKYSQILLNPPIRAGKEIVFSLYDESYNRLVDNGELYIVIQKKQGKDSTFKHLEELFNKVEIINKDKGYYIIKSVK